MCERKRETKKRTSSCVRPGETPSSCCRCWLLSPSSHSTILITEASFGSPPSFLLFWCTAVSFFSHLSYPHTHKRTHLHTHTHTPCQFIGYSLRAFNGSPVSAKERKREVDGRRCVSLTGDDFRLKLVVVLISLVVVQPSTFVIHRY